jgi:penicillin-binding protein 2
MHLGKVPVNKKNIFILFLFILLNFQSVTGRPLFQMSNLDTLITDFESLNSPSTVIIMEASNGFVNYLYRKNSNAVRRFAPGSIAKTWSSVILLENRNIFGNSVHGAVECRGKYFPTENNQFTSGDKLSFNLPYDSVSGKNYFRCSLKRGHGLIGIREALIHSCNVFFLSKASIEPQLFYKKLIKKFHLNENTGARIAGINELPSLARRSATRFQGTASSIGEGGTILVSPLKVAQVYSAIFSGTSLLSPYTNPGSGARMQYPLNISPSARNIILPSLIGVTTVGTLKKLKNKNKNIKLLAGKTGTGTHNRKRYSTHGWNVLYFSFHGKKYVMVVFVYKGSGSLQAIELSSIIINAL